MMILWNRSCQSSSGQPDMRLPKRCPLFRHKGAAATEFLVVGGILISLLFGLPVLGRMGDFNSTTTQASRYLAWELTVGKQDPQQLANEIEHRFYGRPGSALHHGQATAPPAPGRDNPLWASASTGASSPLFETGKGRLRVRLENSPLPGRAGGQIVDGVRVLGSAQNVIPDAKWDLETRGLFNAEVLIDTGYPGSSGSAQEGKNCAGQQQEGVFACMRRNNAILVDSWASRNAGEVAARTRSLVPMGMFRPLGRVMSQAGRIPFFQDLKGLDDYLGRVAPDILPPDRHSR